MSDHREQAQQLAQQLATLIGTFHKEQEKAGTPMLLNDVLSALAHVMGGLLSGLPDATAKPLFNDLGDMVLLSRDAHRTAGEGPATIILKDGEPARIIKPGGKEGTVQ